jgi:PAS domain S-box-containing protein
MRFTNMKKASFGRKLPNLYWIPISAAVVLIFSGMGLILKWQTSLIPRIPFDERLFLSSTPSFTALTILIAGLSLGLQSSSLPFASGIANRMARNLSRVLAGAMLVLSSISLFDIALGVEALPQDLLPTGSRFHLDLEAYRMSFLTAACGMLAGWGLLRLDQSTRSMHYPAEYCALAVAALMSIPIVSFLFNVQVLANLTPSPKLAQEAPPCFMILAIGMLFSRPRHPIMAVLFSPAPGGRLLRSVLPSTLILLVALILLAKWGAHRGYYSEEMILPLALLIGGSMLIMLFWRAALLLNQEYGWRVKGEAELARTNDVIRIVSDFTTDAISVKDRKGRYIYVNPTGIKVLGKQLDDVLGHTSIEVLANHEVAEAIEANNRIVLNEGKADVIEFTLDTPAGMCTYHLTTAPWFGPQGEVMGTVSIATDITDRKRAEDALRAQEARLEKLVEARTQEVRELFGHLETLREEEKRAIARELHDDMGASLTALNMHLAILFQQIPSEPGMAERIVQIKALLGSITATKRRIQNGLRPDKLDIFGIKTALTDQAMDFENYTGVSCAVSLPDEEVKYSTQVETSLFRMVQEALNNIAKHAQASHVDIILDDDGENIYLTIRDNGVGIQPEARPEGPTHGLRGMRERAAYLGGSIAIESKPGAGTRICITLPKTHIAPPLNTSPIFAMDLPKHVA